MALRPKLTIQKPQLRQLARLNLALMLHQLLNIPVRAHEASLQEIRSCSVEPERQSPRESLRVFGERREGVDDHASVIGGDDAGVEGEGSEGWVFCDVTPIREFVMSGGCDKRGKRRGRGGKRDKEWEEGKGRAYRDSMLETFS